MGAGIGSAVAEGLVVGLASGVFIVVLIGIFRGIKKLISVAKSLPQGLATKSSARMLADSKAEEQLYDLVRHEYESGDIRSGLWTKAEATANSTEKAKIRATYIQLRYEQLAAQAQLAGRKQESDDSPTPDEPAHLGKEVFHRQTPKTKTIDDGWGVTPSKIIGGLVIFSLAIGLGVYGWKIDSSRPEVVTGIAGIEIQMTKAEVKVLKGEPVNPNAEPEWIDNAYGVGYFLAMEYGNTNESFNDHLYVFLFGEQPESLKVEKICWFDNKNTLSGIGIGSSEEEVINKFGEPSSIEIAEDELSKKFVYYLAYSVEIIISKGQVDQVCIDAQVWLDRFFERSSQDN